MGYELQGGVTDKIQTVIEATDGTFEKPLSDLLSVVGRIIMSTLEDRAKNIGIDLEKFAAGEKLRITFTVLPPEEEHHPPLVIEQWMIDGAAKLDPIFKEIALKGERAGIFRIEEDRAGGEA